MICTSYVSKLEEVKSCGSDYYGIVTDLNEDAFPLDGEAGGYWYIYKGSYTE